MVVIAWVTKGADMASENDPTTLDTTADAVLAGDAPRGRSQREAQAPPRHQEGRRTAAEPDAGAEAATDAEPAAGR